eukprot:237259-Chlamydomonas_euryale.AAC.2
MHNAARQPTARKLHVEWMYVSVVASVLERPPRRNLVDTGWIAACLATSSAVNGDRQTRRCLDKSTDGVMGERAEMHTKPATPWLCPHLVTHRHCQHPACSRVRRLRVAGRCSWQPASERQHRRLARLPVGGHQVSHERVTKCRRPRGRLAAGACWRRGRPAKERRKIAAIGLCAEHVDLAGGRLQRREWGQLAKRRGGCVGLQLAACGPRPRKGLQRGQVTQQGSQ